MNDIRELDQRLRDSAPVRDEQLISVTGTEAARLLLDEIVAERPARRESTRRRSFHPLARGTWRRAALAAGLASLLAAGLVVGLGSLTSPAAAGLSIERRDGYFVAMVVDLNADPAALRAAFREHGLDVELELVPVSPSLVGEIVALSDDRSGIEHLPDEERGCPEELRCGPIGLRIPLGWDGHAGVTLGREAAPGETYVSAGDPFAPGEALHCVPGVLGARVAGARAELARRGLDAIWHVDERDGGEVRGRILDSSETIGSWFVVAAIPASSRSVHLFADRTAPRGIAAARERAEAGC